jgi:hypothetical protein
MWNGPVKCECGIALVVRWNRKPASTDAGGDQDGQREDLIDRACRQPATTRCNRASPTHRPPVVDGATPAAEGSNCRTSRRRVPLAAVTAVVKIRSVNSTHPRRPSGMNPRDWIPVWAIRVIPPLVL